MPRRGRNRKKARTHATAGTGSGTTTAGAIDNPSNALISSEEAKIPKTLVVSTLFVRIVLRSM